MGHEIGVIFLHHADDVVTRHHLATLRAANPGMPVVPVSNWGVKVSGGLHVRDMVAGWRQLLPSFRGKGLAGAWRRYRLDFERIWIWRNVDLVAYCFMLWPKRDVSAKRWVIFEWDMYCNTSLVDYYGPNFGKPVISTALQIPGINDDFYYFNENEIARIPPSLRPFRMATNPWAGMMFEEDALKAIADRVRELKFCNGFSEVRVATVAKSLGYEPAINANPESQRTLRAVTDFSPADLQGKGVWHRVKKTDVTTA